MSNATRSRAVRLAKIALRLGLAGHRIEPEKAKNLPVHAEPDGVPPEAAFPPSAAGAKEISAAGEGRRRKKSP